MKKDVRSMALTQEELESLTGYKRPSNQLKALAELGIRGVRRPDKTALVLRIDLDCPTKDDADFAKTLSVPALKLNPRNKNGKKKKN